MKRAEKLFDAITDVRDDLVEDALDYRFKRRAPVWQRYATLAACLVLLVGAAAMFRLGIFGGMGGSNSAAMNNAVCDSVGNTSSSPMDTGKAESSSNGEDLKDDAADDGADHNDGGGGETAWPFAEYKGPILPLALRNAYYQAENITAERELTLYYFNYAGLEGYPDPDRTSYVNISDTYLLTNHGAEEQTVYLLYAQAGSYRDYADVSVSGTDQEGEADENGTVFVGAALNEEGAWGAEVYLDALSDEAYLEAAMENWIVDLEEQRFGEENEWPRIFWKRALVTIPAGETIEVQISSFKDASVFEGRTGMDVWDISPVAGSGLSFDSQKVILRDAFADGSPVMAERKLADECVRLCIDKETMECRWDLAR